MTKLPKRIKNIRENLKDKNSKWTQKYVAEKIGVARVTYTAYENGTKTPPPDIIKKIADIFKVSTDFLLGRTDSPNPPDNSHEFDPLSEINSLLKKYNIDQSGFFDIEKWKAMGPEEIKQLEDYFEFITSRAKERADEEGSKKDSNS